MTDGMGNGKIEVCIYFKVSSFEVTRRIKQRFGITEGITVNGECYTSIKQEDWEVFKETERRGFFQIRNKKQEHKISKVTIMKATQEFISTIQKYLEREAEKDSSFKAKWEQSGKDAKQVCNYIMAEVSKSRRCGWADDEIYGMAKHFIDEDDIKDPGEGANRVHRIVTNERMDLSAKDKEEAMAQAKAEYAAQLKAEEAARLAKQKEAEEKKKQAKEERARQKAAQEQSLFGGDLFGGM